MGDISDESIAGKIISDVNTNNKSIGFDLFEGKTIKRKSNLNINRIRIVEVANTFAKIIHKIRDSANINYQNNVANLLGLTSLAVSEIKTKYKVKGRLNKNKALLLLCRKIFEKFLRAINEIYKEDWIDNTNSLIFRSKYISAFLLLFDDSIGNGENMNLFKTKLTQIKARIKSNTDWSNSLNIPTNENDQVFHKNRQAIPNIKFGTNTIHSGLKHYINNNTTWHA